MKAPRFLLTLARVFGFGYPSRVILLVDKDDNTIRIEDFTITKKLEHEDFDKKQNRNQSQSQNQPQGSQEPNQDQQNPGTSIVTDRKTGEVYAVRGDADALFAPRKPSEVYREAGISAVLPGFIVYNILLFWSFEALPPVEPAFMYILGTALILMSVFNARYAYSGVINAFTAMEKADVAGLRVFVPAMREYLALAPTENKQIRDSVVSAIVAKIRPLEAENEKLMQELHQVADKVDRAFKLGLRLRNTFIPTLEKLPAPALLVGIFILGLIIGWVLSGGVGIVPLSQPTINGSVVP